MRTEELTPTRSRVEAARQGRGRLDYFFLILFLLKINGQQRQVLFLQ